MSVATKQWNWKFSDLQEFATCISKIQNPILKQVLLQQFQTERSKFITQQLRQNSPTTNKTTEKDETNEVTILEDKIKHLKQNPVPTKKDADEYFIKQIKGYNQKLNSLVETLPNESSERIKEALIRCKGKEEDAIEALITNTLPQRPGLPSSYLIEFKNKLDSQVKELETKLAAAKIKFSSNNSTTSTQNAPILDLISEFLEHKNDDMYMRAKIQQRTQLLKQRIQQMKENSSKINKPKSKITSQLGSSSLDSQQSDTVSNRNKLYLPGEYEAIESGEPRVFKFKPERTFANETSHIHYRVAEATFFSMCTNISYQVEGVQYIVTPELIKRFEMKRSEIAFSMKKNYSDLKPVFCMVATQEKTDMNSIRLNGFKEDVSKLILCNNYTKLEQYIAKKPFEVMIFLVLLGKTYSSSTNVSIPNGYDSISIGDGSFKVRNSSMILPYYIVSYNNALNSNQHNSYSNNFKGLSEEWNNIEQDAKSDKFMDDCKRFYEETLDKKDKEVKMGRAIDATDLWFTQVYNKRFEKEMQFAISSNDDIYGEGKVVAFDEDGNEIMLDTPSTPHASQTKDDVFEIEEEEEYIDEEML